MPHVRGISQLIPVHLRLISLKSRLISFKSSLISLKIRLVSLKTCAVSLKTRLVSLKKGAPDEWKAMVEFKTAHYFRFNWICPFRWA
jgi:hypothetical protein